MLGNTHVGDRHGLALELRQPVQRPRVEVVADVGDACLQHLGALLLAPLQREGRLHLLGRRLGGRVVELLKLGDHVRVNVLGAEILVVLCAPAEVAHLILAAALGDDLLECPRAVLVAPRQVIARALHVSFERQLALGLAPAEAP